MTYAGEYYHVLNRGNGKQKIFFESENYLFFLRKLKKYIQMGQQEVVAYCLMPNHFHLLLEETVDMKLQNTMLRLQTSFAKAINKRLGKSGHLFQDTYQKILVENNEQLLHLTRYIHMNPVKAGLVTKPEEWQYSSFPDYAGLRRGQLPKMDIVLGQFESREAYVEFCLDNDDVDLGELTLECIRR